jgi:predicted aspartyl protease
MIDHDGGRWKVEGGIASNIPTYNFTVQECIMITICSHIVLVYFTLLLAVLCFSDGFLSLRQSSHAGRQRLLSQTTFNWRIKSGNPPVDTGDGLLEDKIRSMRVKEIKAELSELNVSTQDVFEKEELVQRLLEIRKNGKPPTTASPRRSTSGTDVIVAPLYFTSMDSNLKIAAVNMDGGIRVEPGDQPYATIEFQVTPDGGGSSFPLRLLLDTACSGFVLRPSVVEKHNLPKLSTPVTMTGAGGTVGATGLTQLSKFSIGGESFGPLPAAVQDIGALPSVLDGIVGLSFLNNFAAVDMDFANGKLSLYKRGSDLPDISSDQTSTLVARGTMEVLPQLGIYTVDVTLGSRGPVKMLVDSGAANTFLNWKGVEDLGLSRTDDSFLQRLSKPMGAMGSDNIAMQLTHRLGVSSTLKLGNGKSSIDNSSLPGLSLKETKRLKIDIGDIAILDNMRGQNVGGILGIDALMRSTCVRTIFDGPKKEILMYQ